MAMFEGSGEGAADEGTQAAEAPAPGASRKVFKYGCLRPEEVAHRDLVQAQMDLAHKYFNRLTELARAARDEVRALELAAGLSAPRDALLAARREAGEAYALWAAASRPATGDVRGRHDTARAALKDARAAFAAARREIVRRPDVAAATAEVRERHAQAKRDAREKCGVFWGTYLLVEPAHEQSLKRKGDDGKLHAIPLWDDGEPDNPRFRHWTGDGTVAVQVQGGMTVADLFACEDTRVRIERCPLRTRPGLRGGPPPDPNSNRSRRRGGADHYLWLRVGSDGRAPVWARFKIVMHRPLPADAVVKWVSVHRRAVGPAFEWEAHFTLETREMPADPPGLPPPRGDVVVEFGWRVVDGGLRVATWLAPSGETGHLVLPQAIVDGIRYPEALRSIRDRIFNAAHAGLLSLLRRDPGSLPTWLPGYARDHALHAWRSPERLQRVVLRACDELGLRTTRADYEAWAQPASPEGWGPRDLALWARQERHLWEWERFQDLKARRSRADLYRNFAADLARRYETMVYEEFDMAKVAVTPKTRAKKAEAEHPEPDSQIAKAARSNRFAAATGELRMACVQAFASRRRESYEVHVDLGTQRCNPCGNQERWDAAPRIKHTCAGCGRTWDQDVNHVLNMRDAFAVSRERLVREAAERRAVAAAKAGGGGRWARAKAAKAAKAQPPGEGGAPPAAAGGAA